MSAKPNKTEKNSVTTYKDAIDIVMAERAELARIGIELLTLINQYVETSDDLTDQDMLKVRTKLLELSQHLGNIAGFCDNDGKKLISLINLDLTKAMINEMFYHMLLTELPIIIGIQVDFTKALPFHVVSGSVEVLGQKFKGLLKR